jgi:rhamnose utilization protein RhaD (predicted bifunctional aldolase and dehydrogenase)
MPDRCRVLQQLVEMSHVLGDPSWDCAVLGEGNTSAKIDEETFFVKASGTQLQTIRAEEFVEVRFAGVLPLLERERASDEEIKEVLQAATVGGSQLRPSVETVMHALLLCLPEVSFVGHTHPTAVNAILCARGAQEALAGRLFPDEIVCCGPAPVWIPWTEPGPPLARAIRDRVQAYLEEYGIRPKTILLQNHGLVALGATVEEVLSITAMCVKTCRILLGTYLLGGPNFLPPEMVARLWTRPDEVYRHRLITGRAP